MRLFKLTTDFAFKLLFGKNPDLLLDLLNSFPEFSGTHKIDQLKVLNPEIPKNWTDDKISILDILAEDISQRKFHIEMQAFPQNSFRKRAIYYWSKVYSGSLRKGEPYEKLEKVYSFLFLNFEINRESASFHSVYKLLEKNDPKMCLTEDLEIHIVELPKIVKRLDASRDAFETWMYFIHESENLKGDTMKTLQRKSPALKKAVQELKAISLDKENRALYEARLKGLHDYNSNMQGSYQKGKMEGIEEGLESTLLGIELALELKFNSEGLKLFPEIKNIKDIRILRSILITIKKAKSVASIKKIYSK